jgi:hypothetical protein
VKSEEKRRDKRREEKKRREKKKKRTREREKRERRERRRKENFATAPHSDPLAWLSTGFRMQRMQDAVCRWASFNRSTINESMEPFQNWKAKEV